MRQVAVADALLPQLQQLGSNCAASLLEHLQQLEVLLGPSAGNSQSQALQQQLQHLQKLPCNSPAQAAAVLQCVDSIAGSPAWTAAAAGITRLQAAADKCQELEAALAAAQERQDVLQEGAEQVLESEGQLREQVLALQKQLQQVRLPLVKTCLAAPAMYPVTTVNMTKQNKLLLSAHAVAHITINKGPLASGCVPFCKPLTAFAVNAAKRAETCCSGCRLSRTALTAEWLQQHSSSSSETPMSRG
jgi:hypothetical protein